MKSDARPHAHPGLRPALAGRLNLPFSERRLLLVVGDLAVLMLVCLVALWGWSRIDGGRFGAAFVFEHRFWLVSAAVAWLVVAVLLDLYDVPLAGQTQAVALRVLEANLLLFAIYMVLFFFAPRDLLPRWFVLIMLVAGTAGLTAWRTGYSVVFALPLLRQRALVVGAGWAGQTLAKLLAAHPEYSYEVVGFVDDDADKAGRQYFGVKVLGGSDRLLSLVDELRVGKVIMAITHDMRAELFQALLECEARGVKVRMMTDLYQRLTRRVPVEHINKQWLLYTINGFASPNSLQRGVKRALDLVAGGVGLLALALVLPFVAAAIKLDDGGPVFYRQRRAGCGGTPFRVLKFRTMGVGAEADGRARWACRNDSRVTRLGRWLRRTRLDELPQVWNVLRGEMSVVGPRPERPEFIAELERQIPFYSARLVVKPGLTGWAQIHYRYGNSVEDALVKLQYDLYYIRHQSLSLDLYTLLRTAGVVLRLQGM